MVCVPLRLLRKSVSQPVVVTVTVTVIHTFNAHILIYKNTCIYCNTNKVQIIIRIICAHIPRKARYYPFRLRLNNHDLQAMA